MSSKIQTLLFSALILPFTVQSALAQQKTINPYELPDGSKFFKSRPKVQVYATGPEVTVRMPQPEPKQTLVIEMPPSKVPADEVYTFNAANPSGRPSRPGTMEVDLSNPPPSGFTTNIPQGGPSKPRGLQPGSTTNLLGNKALSGWMGTPQPTSSSGRPGKLLNAVKKPAAAPAVLTYERPAGNGASGNSGAVTKSDVSGKLLLRRALLDNK